MRWIRLKGGKPDFSQGRVDFERPGDEWYEVVPIGREGEGGKVTYRPETIDHENKQVFVTIVCEPQDYRESRAMAYPPIAEQLDALWKGGEALEAMRQQIMAVKKRFPKQ